MCSIDHNIELQVHDEKFFCTEYERSKATADKIARESAFDGLPLVLVYPGVIYGSGKITSGNLVARLVKYLIFHLGLISQSKDKQYETEIESGLCLPLS